MLRPLEYMLIRGIEVVLRECDSSLKLVRIHLKRKCGANYDFKYTMRKIKNYLDNKKNDIKKEDLEILEKLVKGLKNDNII